MHASQHQGCSEEQRIKAERNRPFMRMYAALLMHGIGLFEPDGTACGVGLEALEVLHQHFKQNNSFGRCKFLNRLIAEYKQRWPYRQANYDLN